MDVQFFARGFTNADVEAVFTCFYSGIRIMQGTVGAYVDKVFSGKLDFPFVLQAEDGCLAVGGVIPSSNKIFKNYAIGAVINAVKKIHADGMHCSVVSMFAGARNTSLLIVCPVGAEGDLRDSEEDYAKLETYVSDWIELRPGMYV